MICPYNRKSLTYVRQTNKDLDEETGTCKSEQDIVKEEYTLMECQRENCGAWHKGKCNYYTAANETNE